jgi:hypothetical protein
MLLEFFVQPRPDPYEIVVDEVALLTQAEAVTESAR